MRRIGLLLAAILACGAGAHSDHAILQRAIAERGMADVEADTAEGPALTRVRILGVSGEGCETRIALSQGDRVLDWRTAGPLQLSRKRQRGWIGIGETPGRLILWFDSVDDATVALLAMERLQTACRTPPP